MIVSDRFEGDNNEALKCVQHDMYWSLLPFLYTYPKRIYRRAISYTGIKTELYEMIREKEKFDHRVLQDAHDKIAAFCRYQHPDKLGQLVLPLAAPDCGNSNLEETLKGTYTREWSSYWYEEVRSISEEPLIVRAILTAVAYQNTDDGYEAEDLLLGLLRDRYDKFWDTGVTLSRQCRKNKSHDTMQLPPEINKRLFC